MSVLHSLLQFFIKYKYQAIIPIAILEGPIISIICGFLVSIGVLELSLAFAVVLFGDVI
jgi:membrane protein DedA with SNARE-associated domain